jgi:hypothetical protein
MSMQHKMLAAGRAKQAKTHHLARTFFDVASLGICDMII